MEQIEEGNTGENQCQNVVANHRKQGVEEEKGGME
jgi:hypothetical protein